MCCLNDLAEQSLIKQLFYFILLFSFLFVFPTQTHMGNIFPLQSLSLNPLLLILCWVESREEESLGAPGDFTVTGTKLTLGVISA